MRLELTGRHVDITPPLRRLVNTKLSKLERLLNDSAVSARAVLSREKYRLQADLSLHARGEKFLHGVGSSASWEASVDQAIDKISQQAQKMKGKWLERKRRGSRGAVAEEPIVSVPSSEPAARRVRPRMPRIIKSSRQAIKTMSLAEAARAIDPREDGLVVFRDPERASISVLYRRNGELTLVETEP